MPAKPNIIWSVSLQALGKSVKQDFGLTSDTKPASWPVHQNPEPNAALQATEPPPLAFTLTQEERVRNAFYLEEGVEADGHPVGQHLLHHGLRSEPQRNGTTP